MKWSTFIDTFKQGYAMALVLALCLLSVPTVVAANEPGSISLAEQLVIDAKEMERGGQVNAAIDMLLKAEQQVTSQSTPGQLARFYNKLAEMSATVGHAAEQQQYAEKGLALLNNENVPIVADLNYNLGLAYEMKADYDAAESAYKKGLGIAELTGNRLLQGRGKLYIAALHTQKDDYTSAINLMREAYAISQEVDNDELSWEVLNELGLLYNYTGDTKQSLQFHLQALQASENLKMRELIIVSLYNTASNYLELRQYENANIYFEKMLEQSKNSTEKSNMYNAYQGFSLSSYDVKEYQRALAYMLKAEEYLKHVQGVMIHFHHHVMKAQILSRLEQTSKALEELSIAEQKIPKDTVTSSNSPGLTILNLKSQFYAELGQYRKAYEILDEYAIGYQKARNKENDLAVEKLRITFDTERNQSRNHILERDNQIKALQLSQTESKQQIQTFFLVALALLSLGLIFVMYRQLHSRRQLKIIAETDSLTDLSNRRYAFASGKEMVKQGRLSERKVSVILFDLDHFKSVNDSYGHPAGDTVLKTVAEISKCCLRDSDVMARIGGEEFLAILPGVQRDKAQYIAGRLKDTIAKRHHEFAQQQFAVTASFGVATINENEDFDGLIQRADKALYQAKDNGRNRVEVA